MNDTYCYFRSASHTTLGNYKIEGVTHPLPSTAKETQALLDQLREDVVSKKQAFVEVALVELAPAGATYHFIEIERNSTGFSPSEGDPHVMWLASDNTAHFEDREGLFLDLLR